MWHLTFPHFSSDRFFHKSYSECTSGRSCQYTPNGWAAEERFPDKLSELSREQRLRECTPHFSYLTQVKWEGKLASGVGIWCIVFIPSSRHCVYVYVCVCKRCLLMEIVQLWKAAWTAAGLRREEVVWVKAAVVWICVYLGKPAVATLPACCLKFFNTTTNTLWRLLLKARGDICTKFSHAADPLEKQFKNLWENW